MWTIYWGKYEEYYENGKKIRELIFKGGHENGEVTIWHTDAKHTKAAEGYYKHGKRDGFWKTWYESGNKQFERMMRNGKVNGNATYYYNNANNSPKVTGFFTDMDPDKNKPKIYYPRT